MNYLMVTIPGTEL